LSVIERIEIVRGAASSLYGADALGGVIQIFTKRGNTQQKFSGNAELACGSRGTCKGDIAASGNLGVALWSIGLGGEESSGQNAITNPVNYDYNPDIDGYRNTYQTAMLSWRPSDDHRVTFSFFRDQQKADIDAGLGAGGGSLVSPAATHPDAGKDAERNLYDRLFTLPFLRGRQKVTIGADDYSETVLRQSNLSGNHRLTDSWTVNWQATLRDNQLTSTGYGNQYRYNTRGKEFSVHNTVSLDWGDALQSLNGDLLVGAEYRSEKVTGTVVYDEDQRDTASVLMAYRWQHGAHSVFTSGRIDHTEQYGNKPTGGFQYGYELTPNWKVAAGIATAFKAPTFNDLYYPNYANPYLLPEKSTSFEASVSHTRAFEKGRILFKTTAWHTRVRDLIVIQCDALYKCFPENVNRAKISGVNFSVDGYWQDYTSVLSLDWQHAKDETTGNTLPRRAKLHGSATFGKTWGEFYTAVNTTFSGRRFDDAMNARQMGGYGIVSFVAEWRQPVAGTTLIWFAKLNNIFDKKYELAADYQTEGRSLMTGVRGSW
ncbi:MAG: TonB-dependent receptor, partial [Burkholderiales bacterium]|jgi:vitamin B12 transporter|nr:TonB-dependent receptor [Burkholderiales bacterium]